MNGELEYLIINKNRVVLKHLEYKYLDYATFIGFLLAIFNEISN